MRRILLVLFLTVTMLSCSGCQSRYTHGVYEVTCVATQVANHSVGNDWNWVYSHKGRIIQSGEQWIAPLNTAKVITIDAIITESDKWPDIGSGSLPVVLKDGFESTCVITVVENNGKYKGHTAQWEIVCKVNLTKRLRHTEL